jgi:hypothetical protein
MGQAPITSAETSGRVGSPISAIWRISRRRVAKPSWHDPDVTSPAGEDRRPRVALFGVDAFTDRPFGGNPAMVCLLPGAAGDGGCSGPLPS